MNIISFPSEVTCKVTESVWGLSGSAVQADFKWEHSPGKVLNGNIQQANFQMGTLSKQSFKWKHSAGKVPNGNTLQAEF
jgi:hypothetical protein